MRKRRIWSEGTFAILKARHRFRRAIRRGLDKMQQQLQMASVAPNIRRMAAAIQYKVNVGTTPPSKKATDPCLLK